jgi:predicted nucleic acid-binding protein
VNGFLADTNVLSEFFRLKGPDPLVRRWLQSIHPKTLYVSVLTLAETLRGIELLEPGKRRTEMEQWFHTKLRPSFTPENVLNVTEAIATRWAIQTVRLAKRGIPITLVDGLLVATAIEHDLVIATRDSDIMHAGGPVFNPWKP